MALGDAYCDNVTYKAIIGKTSGDDDTEIDSQLLFVSRWVERFLGYKETGFNIDTAVANRIFYPRGYYSGNPEAENPWLGTRATRDLEVDPIATTTGLVITVDTDRDGSFADETALAATDYELRPLNADKSPEPRPWLVVHLPTWSTLAGWYPGSPVQVTAKFGWPAVPQAIVQLTAQLVAIWRLETPRATSQISAGFDTVIGTSGPAQSILKDVARSYKRTRLFS